MIPIVFSLQNKLDKTNNKVLAEIHQLSDDFSKLESELSVTEEVNSLLLHRLANLKLQCQAKAQYSRQEYLDIIDIHSQVEADVLEEKVFEKLGCNIPFNCTAACHRVSKKGVTVISKFSRRKDCQQVLAVKTNLRKTKIEDVDLPGQKKLFINKNLYLYYKVLWFQGKKLHILGKINSSFILGNTVKIKVSENSLPLSITHADDFGKYFLDIDLSPPERSVYINKSICWVNHGATVFFLIVSESTLKF